jgi:hypothetical protein
MPENNCSVSRQPLISLARYCGDLLIIPLRIGDRNKRLWQRPLSQQSFVLIGASLATPLVEVDLLSAKSSLSFITIMGRTQGSKI